MTIDPARRVQAWYVPVSNGVRLPVAPACFDRYGPAGETFTVQLGDHSALELPILPARPLPRLLR